MASSIRRIGATSAIVLALTLIGVYILEFGLFPAAGFDEKYYYDTAACFQFAMNHPGIWHAQEWLCIIFGAALVPFGIALHERYRRTDNGRAMLARAFALVSGAMWILTGAIGSTALYFAGRVSEHGIHDTPPIIFGTLTPAAFGIELGAIFTFGFTLYL